MATKKIPTLVPDHVFVPKNEILTKKEAEQVLENINCNPPDLPFIFLNDPAL